MKSLELLSELININSIKINLDQSFTWASGWRSPFYFDNRISLSYPKIRSAITSQLIELLKSNFTSFDVISGVATAGIPQGALISDKLSLPFAYVRSKAKSHGMQNMIEGRIKEGSNVILIEDLISTGGSSIKAVDAIRSSNSNVLGVISIFNYGFNQSIENFKKINCKTFSLFYFDDLLTIALEKKIIRLDDLDKLKKWRNNPEKWR